MSGVHVFNFKDMVSQLYLKHVFCCYYYSRKKNIYM